MSKKLARNPYNPADRFVKWVEFAAEYSDLNELNLPYYEWNFLTYYSLDVILVSLAVLVGSVMMVLMVLRRLVSLAAGRMGQERRIYVNGKEKKLS